MEIIKLTNDNISDYAGYINPDVSESIGREYYRGAVAVKDDTSPQGALVWEYKNLESDADTDAELYFIDSESKEALKSLLAEYDKEVSSCDVKKSFFDLADLDDETAAGLTEDGFSVSEGESRDLLLTVADLKPITSLKKKIGDNIVGLDELMELQFIQGVTNCLFKGRKGLVEDLEYLEKDWFDESVSSCVITDGKVSGMLLIHRFSSGTLMPVLFHASGPDSKIDLLSMIAFTAKRAFEKYPQNTGIIIRRHNDMVKALAGKLFSGRTGQNAVSGNRE